MGIDLSRLEDAEQWSCSNALWGYVLESAEKGGWTPEGTDKLNEETESEDTNWDSSDYSTQAGQQVTDSDSKNMAEALDNYLKGSNPKEIEERIIKSFLEWVRYDDNGELYYPGFEIY
jgi:hypothetical protein